MKVSWSEAVTGTSPQHIAHIRANKINSAEWY